MTYKELNSPNFDDRRNGQIPRMIIVHYTGTQTAREAEDIYMTPGRVSPHYMIYEDGSVTRFVNETKRAWHAGKASWDGFEDINSASIGIEIWNTGHEHDCEDFLPAQIESLIELIRDIRSRWNIPDYYILAHSDVAPGRKIDPGEKFPWPRLAEKGIGLLPRMTSDDIAIASDWMDEPKHILAALMEYGYDYPAGPDCLIREFRRHFLPETLDAWGADADFCAALASLLRRKRAFDSDNQSEA